MGGGANVPASIHGVNRSVTVQEVCHLIFQMQLQFLQANFLDLLLLGKVLQVFKFDEFRVILVMLIHELAEPLVRRHQMRFQFFLRV